MLAGNTFRFVGRIDPEHMPALYAEADVFVNASVIDNQPVSIIEALSAGLPVVSTPTGDIRFMLRDGHAGVLVPPDDPRAMAHALLALWRDPIAPCGWRIERGRTPPNTWRRSQAVGGGTHANRAAALPHAHGGRCADSSSVGGGTSAAACRPCRHSCGRLSPVE
jgi:glycosyltransferase involved in cell wall biosynthesis